MGCDMAEEAWHAARLIPTSGISGAEEQERRGTSALLAVLASVKEFGRSITTELGAPVGTLESYIEVPFKLGGREVRPDGLIRVTRGQRTWTALVEVKTGKNELRTDQLEAYLDVAKEQGFDVLLTISNEIPTAVGTHPTAVDKRKTRKVSLRHLSWSQIHTEAIMERLNRSVADPDQAWILSELIRYLEHPKSGSVDFDDMGASWVTVRDAVVAGTARATENTVCDVAGRWEQLLQYGGMQLGRQLGIPVLPALSRREVAEPALRLQEQAAALASGGVLTGGLRVPDTVGPLQVSADLRAGRISCSVSVDAPREGRPLTRVNWLLRQLKDAPEDLRIDAFVVRSRGASQSEQIRKVRDEPALLLDQSKREIRSFVVTLSAAAGTKRGQGKGSFVASVLDLIDAFYAEVMQQLKPWSAVPPRIRQPEADLIDNVGASDDLQSTALSTQDADVQPAAAQVE
jgi:hypothetical protein